MKTILSVLTMLVIGSTVFAQTNPTVTVKTEGTRNRQVVVDDKTYTLDNTNADKSIAISNLELGQHSLRVVRSNQTNRNVSNFTLRDGYDLAITISQNGSISTSETRIANRGNTGSLISTNAFNRLYNQTRNKTGATAKANFLETEFNRVNRRFTSKQATQLIQLVNSESLRLKLAKQSYLRISDQENFHLVFELLNSTASKNSLNDYLISVKNGTTSGGQQLTEAQFSTIYNEVIAEGSSSSRVYYLNNFFDRDFNNYTSTQAKQLIQTVTGDQDRLALAKRAYRGVVDKNNYYNTVSSLLTYLSGRSELLAYINSYNTNNSGNQNTAMNETEFNRLYTAVRNAWTSSTKYTVVATAFNTSTNYFTTSQVRLLLLQISAEPDRLTLAKNAYDNIVDLNNYTQLYEVISSTNGKNELAAFVANKQGVTSTVKIPMTETEFNSIYRNIQLTFGIGAKYNSLTELFNTESKYFTVAQAKQLIQLVSSESNRLELAKLSYNNITDPTNFSSIYDIFSSQSSKNELINYVESNAGIR